MNKEKVLPKYESFLRDESCLVGYAENIVFPTNADELVQKIKDAVSQKSIVTVQGARTGLVGGAVPSGGIIVNLSKMDKLSSVCKQGDKALMHVQAGVTLQHIETEARKNGLYFPANPTEHTATIGGIFSTGAAGLGKLMHGATSQYIQSMRWILSDGDMWDIGRGKYVFDECGCTMPNGKRLECRTDLPLSPLALNIPRDGMDLIDFLGGSEGRLGIAADFDITLVPLPKELWGVVYFFEKDKQALNFANKLSEWRNIGKNASKNDVLLGVEYFDNGTLDMLASEKHQNQLLKSLPDFPQNAHTAIYVELCGDEPDKVEESLMYHLELFADSGGADENTWAENSPAGVQRFRDMRHAVIELVNSKFSQNNAENNVCVRYETDFTGPPVKNADYINMYHKDMANYGVQGIVYGHILQNNLHVALMADSIVQDTVHNIEQYIVQNIKQNTVCEKLINRWAKIVMDDGGQLVSENGIGKLKRKFVDDHMSEMLKDEAKKIKSFFDPQNLINTYGRTQS